MKQRRGRQGALWTIMLCAAVALGGAERARAEDRSGPAPLRIVGSGYTMPVLMRPWAAAFESQTGIAVEIVPSGTSTGPPALIEGRADIAAMTRPLREAEAEAISRRFGAAAIVFPIAEDEVAVFVNADNPVERLTIAQIDAIYSQERRCGGLADIQRWGQLGASQAYADRAIALFGRRPGSGTATFFRARALCGGPFKDWMRISPGSTSASLRVVESRFGIGFGSLRDRKPGMKVLAIAEAAAGPYFVPGMHSGESDTGTERYALARTLDFVLAPPGLGSVRPELVDFLELVLRDESLALVREAGYEPLSAGRRKEARKHLDELRATVAARE